MNSAAAEARKDVLPRKDVLLLRSLPEDRNVSMDRFGDEMERGFAVNPDFRVAGSSIHRPRMGARPGFQSIGGHFARFVRYPLSVRGRHADVYHIADHVYGHLAAFLPRDRTVITCHDLMLLRAEEGVTGFRGRRRSVISFRLSTAYLNRVAHVVCPSHSTKADLLRLRNVSEARVSVVPHGVAKHFCTFSEQASERLKGDIPRLTRYGILHVSSGQPYKNVGGTLAVVAALRDMGLDTTLVRVGEPLTPAERTLAATLRLTGSIVDCGRVSDQRLIELYNACDVLLFPSYYEGFGWPVLEAMACGTPVVSSNSASLVEIIGEAGMTIPPENVGEMSRAVRTILESKEVASELRGRGLRRAAQYTWEKAVARYARVYRQVASEAEGMIN